MCVCVWPLATLWAPFWRWSLSRCKISFPRCTSSHTKTLPPTFLNISCPTDSFSSCPLCDVTVLYSISDSFLNSILQNEFLHLSYPLSPDTVGWRKCVLVIRISLSCHAHAHKHKKRSTHLAKSVNSCCQQPTCLDSICTKSHTSTGFHLTWSEIW